ncbi:RTA1 like protein-domain-containing protein [Mycena capillaripes]|nr:RTA1 like protein-domain-containing protein [Mycena capillaripes]
MLSDLEFRALAPAQIIHSPYHYIPTRWICITFLSLFGISTLLHVGQALIYRAWYTLPTAALCGVLEIVGWLARLSSSLDPGSLLPYEIQMTATIIAPTPLLAVNFLTPGKIIQRLGPQYSRLTPKIYSAVFLACDLIALGVQAAGGALASIAVGKKKDPNNVRDQVQGGHIMLGGIIFQLTAIIVYVCLAAEFILRYTQDKPINRVAAAASAHHGARTPRLTLLISALAANTACLVVRAVYRTVELIDGFSGPIISTQWYFNVFDGAMIVVALVLINVAHPEMLLQEDAKTMYGKMERDDGDIAVQLKPLNSA